MCLNTQSVCCVDLGEIETKSETKLKCNGASIQKNNLCLQFINLSALSACQYLYV